MNRLRYLSPIQRPQKRTPGFWDDSVQQVLSLSACSWIRLQFSFTVPTRKGEAGKYRRGPAVRNGTRAPNMLHMFSYNVIGPCIIVIVEEWKTNLVSLAILFHFLRAQHVSNITISINRSLRLCCWITTSVVLFSVRCVLEIWCAWFWVVLVLQAEAQLQNEHHSKPATTNFQHTTNWEQNDRCGNSTTQSQAPDDGYINVRNM